MASLRSMCTPFQRALIAINWKQSCSSSVFKLTSMSRTQTAKGITRCMSEGMGPGSKMHRPTSMDKKILVWNGCYPSVDQVPETVSYAQLHKAKDWFRIRASLGMVLLTVLACLAMVVSGKQAVARGESVHKMNMEWHRRNKEEAEAAAAAK